MHNIRAVLIPPFQEIKDKAINLKFGWKLTLENENENNYENAIIISTDYFGGFGDQYATVIKDFKVVPEKEWNTSKYNPINDALKYFKLSRLDNYDEFDTIGLGNFRDNQEIKNLLNRIENVI